MPHEQLQVPSPDSLRRGYELPSVNLRGLGLFFILFIVTAIVLHLGLWGLLKFGTQGKRTVDYPESAVEFHAPPPGPQLQPSPAHPYVPAQDLAQMREEENRLFAKLGWQTEGSGGHVTIPETILVELTSKRSK